MKQTDSRSTHPGRRFGHHPRQPWPTDAQRPPPSALNRHGYTAPHWGRVRGSGHHWTSRRHAPLRYLPCCGVTYCSCNSATAKIADAAYSGCAARAITRRRHAVISMLYLSLYPRWQQTLEHGQIMPASRRGIAFAHIRVFRYSPSHPIPTPGPPCTCPAPLRQPPNSGRRARRPRGWCPDPWQGYPA